MWSVEYSDNFQDWWLDLTEAQQDAVTAKVELLQEEGPSLGRLPNWNAWYEHFVPIADDLYDEHLHELRKEGLI
jgi:hypothetical protein